MDMVDAAHAAEFNGAETSSGCISDTFPPIIIDHAKAFNLFAKLKRNDPSRKRRI